jgi:serine protease Do
MQESQMKKHTHSLVVLAVAVALMATACGTTLSGAFGINPEVTPVPTVQPVPTGPALVQPRAGAGTDLLAAYEGTLEELYNVVSPSVVNIRVVRSVAGVNPVASMVPGFPFFNLPRGGQEQPQQQYASALGSGFVWDSSGNIVTNNHVVTGAEKIEVTFSDGATHDAKLVGADPDSDLAVIQVEDAGSLQLQPVSVADSSTVKVGQLAVAIGNPFGLEGTMTAGIVSAIGRSLPADQNTSGSYSIPDVIQTDAPINPGNSGGVLVDVDGRVIGVTSAIESPVRANAGIGFAIPSDIVMNVVPALIQDGGYEHTWLGISGITLTPDLASAMNLDAGQRGALIEEVLPNSPAQKSGLRGSDDETSIEGQTIKIGGDVITAIDGTTVRGMDDLIAYLARSTQVDQKVSLSLIRGGKEQTLEVTLAARPSAEQRTASADQRGVTLGILGTTVDESIASEMNLPDRQTGVLVEEVQPGSLADTAGLRAGTRTVTINGQQVTIGGDVITELNGQPVAGIEELKAGLAQLPSGDELSLTLLRDGKEVRITLQSAG